MKLALYKDVSMDYETVKDADPIDARCAVKGTANQACAIRAATKNMRVKP